MCLNLRIENNCKYTYETIANLERMIHGGTHNLANSNSIDNISGMYRDRIVDLVSDITSNLIKLELDIACLESKEDENKIYSISALCELCMNVYNRCDTIKDKVNTSLRIDAEDVKISIDFLIKHLKEVIDRSFKLLIKTCPYMSNSLIKKVNDIENITKDDSNYIESVYSFGTTVSDLAIDIQNEVDCESCLCAQNNNMVKNKILVLWYMRMIFGNVSDEALKVYSEKDLDTNKDIENLLLQLKNTIHILNNIAV